LCKGSSEQMDEKRDGDERDKETKDTKGTMGGERERERETRQKGRPRGASRPTPPLLSPQKLSEI
jgi:hypothetical protein